MQNDAINMWNLLFCLQRILKLHAIIVHRIILWANFPILIKTKFIIRVRRRRRCLAASTASKHSHRRIGGNSEIGERRWRVQVFKCAVMWKFLSRVHRKIIWEARKFDYEKCRERNFCGFLNYLKAHEMLLLLLLLL